MSTITQFRLPQRRTEHCMGTLFSFDIRLPGVEPAVLEATIDWLHWADSTFSTYRPTSQISRLARGESTVADCLPEVRAVLARCTELEAETGGYFSAIADGRLDPSGLVKGWAVERASAMLVTGGSVNHCVNGGGDVQCAGGVGPAQPWRVGIAHPLQPGRLAGVVSGYDLAVATSGNAERGAHVVDPHRGNSPTELASVTIVGRHLGTADAYATAAYAMGTAAPSWIEARSEYSGLVVFADGREWSSPGFAA